MCTFHSILDTDWESGQPDGGTSENCLVLNFDGLLSDVACQLYFSFNVAACEITKIEASTAQPSTVIMTTPGKLRRQERDSRG